MARRFPFWLIAVIALAVPAFSACQRQPHSPAPAAGEPPVVTVALAGDTGLGLAVEAIPWIEKNGYHRAFDHVRGVIADADFFVLNLEAPIVPPDTESIFGQRRPWQDARVAQALAQEGVDAVGLANNHLMDFGRAGMDTTLAALNEAGLKTFGAGENLAAAREPLILEKSGVKIGIVAGCRPRKWPLLAEKDVPGVAPLTEPRWSRDIAALKKRVDFVIAYPHWGDCYHRKLKEHQRDLAAAAIKAGADLVVGHHPHIPQTVEWIDGKPVFFSIGNFVYHGVRKKSRKATLDRDYAWVLTVAFSRSALESITVTPFFNHNLQVDFTPRPATPTEARGLFDVLLPRDSQTWQVDGNHAVLRPPRT